MTTNINKGNHYRITIEELNAAPHTAETLQFEFQDRENLFKLIENLKIGSGLEAPLIPKVAVALRLLGPVMMQNRKHPLFAEFMPHFKTFMQNLKNTVKKSMLDKG